MSPRNIIDIYKEWNAYKETAIISGVNFNLATSRSDSTTSAASAAAGFILNDEPITLFRLELERLQYILHFPEEVAFQVRGIKCKA